MNDSEKSALDEIIETCIETENADCEVVVTKHTLYFLIDERRAVEVMLPYERFEEMEPAHVLWATLRATDPKSALNFANVVKAAAAIAFALNSAFELNS